MRIWNYIIKSFSHYLKSNLLVAIGVAVSTMVLTGAFIIGDSIRYSLNQAAFYRLGEMTHLVSAPERYFRQALAAKVEAHDNGIEAAPVLMLEGMAVADGGQQRSNSIQVIGVDSQFESIAKTSIFSSLAGNEVIISENLAERLDVHTSDQILVRVKKASLIPKNAPFVSEEEPSVAFRAVIVKVVDEKEMGRFNLKTSQSAPYNLFVSLERLNRLMEMNGRINHLLISTGFDTHAVTNILDECISPADGGLKLRDIVSTGEKELSSERVFMETHIAELVSQLPQASPHITYFVNGITLQESVGDNIKTSNRNTIPYSFVSSLNHALTDDEIILTQWAADDIGARPGDSIRINYFKIGPLRQLFEEVDVFVLKEIVSMSQVWADSTRMPWLPGLSDAGHCREWDTGVPIDLDAIQEKDEAYWNEWKGAPKAYVSLNKAKQMWENRFGSYTAVRFPGQEFDETALLNRFKTGMTPGDIGMIVEPVKQNSIDAARNGTDFTGLFIGLSFFILAAAIILIALLFRLNLESRSGEAGILSALGFQNKQIKRIFILEGFVVALFGGTIGLLLSVLYTSAVFRILNTLWYDIVRTDVLMIKVNPGTLVLGITVSTFISLLVIYYSIHTYLKGRTSELQKKSDLPVKKGNQWAFDVMMWMGAGIPLVLITIQLFQRNDLNPVAFFISGGFLLHSILLGVRKFLLSLEQQQGRTINLVKLSGLNLLRNRSRSLTIIILFALGTFSVISTGSYKLDLLTGSHEKTSGTGGFLYFTKSSMPVLHDMNDPVRKAEEGLSVPFTAVQFLQVEGDDASCLNLNRISQPAILGVEPADLKGRFSFTNILKDLDSADPWNLLNQKLPDGTIPAIADQTVIQWGLGKKIGDDLLYQNERGDTLQLKLIAGTAPSIFQGYVLISSAYFLENFPSGAGSNVILIDGEKENESLIADELQSVYRDYGWEMEPTTARLSEFYSVTNTYLSIFLALGALGLLLGTIGLAVILARAMIERRYEIALMLAAGFQRKQLYRLLLLEFMILIGAGVITGFITAVMATLPSFLSTQTDASLRTVSIITFSILLNGFLWIAVLSWWLLGNKNPAGILRAE